MAARGSLTYCKDKMLAYWQSGAPGFLSIVANNTGKYYTVMTDDQLATKTESASATGQRLLFRGTFREMKILCKTPQRDLFSEDINADNP